jgi:hypothetical protein
VEVSRPIALESARFQPSNLSSENPVSKLCFFKCNLHRYAMGPVIFLRRSSLPLVRQFFAEVEPTLPASVPYHHLMGHMVKFMQSKVPLYALEVGG